MAFNLEILLKWVGKSVCGLVVIAGIIFVLLSIIFADQQDLKAWGIAFVLLGLIGAILMTLIIRGKFP